MSVERRDDAARRSTIQKADVKAGEAEAYNTLVQGRDARPKPKYLWFFLAVIAGIAGFFFYRHSTGIVDTPETAVAAFFVLFGIVAQFLPLIIFYLIFRHFRLIAKAGGFKSKKDLMKLLDDMNRSGGTRDHIRRSNARYTKTND